MHVQSSRTLYNSNPCQLEPHATLTKINFPWIPS